MSRVLLVFVFASFKNIKFPRGNYQTDSSDTETLYCLYCSPLNFLPRALIQKRGCGEKVGKSGEKWGKSGENQLNF